MPVKAFRISVGLALIALAVACNKKADNPQAALAAGEVEIELTCDGGTFTANVNPWRVTMSQLGNKKGIRWKLKNSNSNHGVDSASIDSVKGKPWPFKTKKFSVKKGSSVDGDSANTYDGPAAVYHYQISTVCTLNGVTDTIVIDPDMILPPRNILR